MTDMTRIGGATPKIDYAVQNKELQQKDRSGLTGFMGRVWNAITRTPDQKNENRLAVREYIGQVAQRFGLEAARGVAMELSGHLVKGNPLSSHRLSIINAKLEQQHPDPNPAQQLAGGIARAFAGKPTTDLAQILTSPTKSGACQTMERALTEFKLSTQKMDPMQKFEASVKLKDDVVAQLKGSGLEVDPVTLKSNILEPLLRLNGIDPGTTAPTPSTHAPKRDLTSPQTVQGERTEKGSLGVAFECSSAMVIAQANKSESTIQALMPQVEKRMGTLFDGLKQYVDRPDLGTKDLPLLKELYGQMKVGFAPEGGGIGRFAKFDDWNPKWTEGKFELVEGKGIDSPANKEALDNLKSMLTYFAGHVGDHIGDGRSVHEKDLRGTQFNAICGMIIQDVLLNDGMDTKIGDGPNKDNSCRESLKGFLVGQDKVFGTIPEAFRNNVRGNPLLMEIDNGSVVKSIKKTVVDTLAPGFTKEERDKLVSLIETPGLNGEPTSGARGRFLNNTSQLHGDITKEFSKRDKPINNCMVMPDGNLDEEALDKVGELTSGGDSFGKVKELVDTIRDKDTDLLGHSSRPLTMQRQYTLPTRFQEALFSPENVLRNIQPSAACQSPEDKALFERFKQSIAGVEPGTPELLKLQENLQSMPIKDKQKVDHTLGELVHETSVTNLIHSRDMRTLCSISGTTTDISLSLMAQMNQEEVRDMMVPLVRIANGEQGVEIPQKTKDLFTTISFFMQGGQYHTPAEVIGGMFMAGVALQGEPAIINPKDPQALRDGYARLLDRLGERPEEMFSVPERDQESFRSHVGTVVGDLQQTQIDNLNKRLQEQPGKGRSFEAPF